MKTIHVWVTLKDIAQGVPLSHTECPIAIAIRRAGALWAQVYGEEIFWQMPNEAGEHSADTSPTMREFMDAFDNHRPGVIPFPFNLQERWDANAQKRGVA
jgi:hypothetical protein